MAKLAPSCGRPRPKFIDCGTNSASPHWPMLCVLLVLGCINGCSNSPDPGKSPGEEPELDSIIAEVMPVKLVSWPTVLRSQGSLFADEQSVLGSKVAGRVAVVHVDLGDQVKQGEPIVTLETDEFRLLVEQVEAQLEQARSAGGLAKSVPLSELSPENSPPVRQERAIWEEVKRNLERASNLMKENPMSEGEFDQIAAAERVAEARYSAALNGVREKIALIGVRTADLELAKQQLDEAVIRSPIDGFVARRDVAPGTYLSAGQSVAVIVRTNPLRFRGTVPERFAQSLQVGQAIRLKIESIEQPRFTTISRISPALDQQSRALSFEANLENDSAEAMRTGLFAEAEVTVDTAAQAIVVPNSAIIEFAGAQKVWTVVGGVAAEREVLCGVRRGEFREVIEGLKVGELILAEASKGRVAKVTPSKRVAQQDETPANESKSEG